MGVGEWEEGKRSRLADYGVIGEVGVCEGTRKSKLEGHPYNLTVLCQMLLKIICSQRVPSHNLIRDCSCHTGLIRISINKDAPDSLKIVSRASHTIASGPIASLYKQFRAHQTSVVTSSSLLDILLALFPLTANSQ
jgi:hypothetical protein